MCAEQIKKYFVEKYNIVGEIIQDQFEDLTKNELFSDSKYEKLQRGNLKSAVQRLLKKDSLVIADSMNYIKGFRYEIFCVVKSARTPHCVVFCDAHPEKVKELNTKRSPENKYSDTLMNELIMRFETPNPEARWDSPLFRVSYGEDIPMEQIYDALYQRKAPPPNQSTQSPPLAATNFVHELDNVSQKIVMYIIDTQKTTVVGDEVSIPGSKEKLKLTKVLTLAELQRLKRQFITFSKSRAVDSVANIPNMFIHFLNNSLQ